jgi:peptide/nickel transport system permease protein
MSARLDSYTRSGPSGQLRLAAALRAFGPDPLTVLGFIAFFGLVFVALFGERLAPHESIYFVVEHGSDPRPYDPGLVFPLGSDVLGRDIVSLVLAGARQSLTIILLAGTARVLVGVLVAAVSSWWRPTRIAIETIAALVSAIPATLVALVIVRVFVKTADASIGVFIGALLLIGWAGPYRVIRAEVDRLARAPFTQGAVALGVGKWRLFWRHQLPHLVPVIALNLSQQVIASLVLLAELGVVGAFVGVTRLINIEESLHVVQFGVVNGALIADPPEWGGLLAGARTVESLWTTRWLILVPGLAFALTALAVAAIGFALARRYARRDIVEDVRRPATAALGLAVLMIVVASSLVPERYAAARAWATAARAEIGPTLDTERAFASANLRPLGSSFAVERTYDSVVQTAPASVAVGGLTVGEAWPRPTGPRAQAVLKMEPFVTANTGGGHVEGSLVFVGRGLSPAEYPPQPRNPFQLGSLDLGTSIQDYADEYAGIDVRGKVVLMVRFLGVAGGIPPRERFRRLRSRGSVPGIPAADSIAGAIKRGAAAVLFVDRDLNSYDDGADFTTTLTGGLDPYRRVARDAPAANTSSVPVIVLSETTGKALAAAAGLDLTPFVDCSNPGICPALDLVGSTFYTESHSRALGLTARVDVPLTRTTAAARSYVGEVPGVAIDAPRVVVWAPRKAAAAHPSSDVLAILARTLGSRGAPFIFVDFDPAVDPRANARAISEVLGPRRIDLVVVIDDLDGEALRFTTANGDLIPAFDLYADKADARHVTTTATTPIGGLPDVVPFIDQRTVVMSGSGGASDLRPDAVAVIGYLAGRIALGAEELRR